MGARLFVFNARDHETFVDAFYDIARDRDNKVVILTGDGGEWMSDIDFASFGDVSDPDVWAKIHDEGLKSSRTSQTFACRSCVPWRARHGCTANTACLRTSLLPARARRLTICLP